jgi:hypothetical protein
MYSESEKCKKCKKFIYKNNLLLHEITCNGNNNLIEGNIKTTDLNNMNNIIPATNNIEEEFYHCEICDTYLDSMDKFDHLYMHELNQPFDIPNGRNNNMRTFTNSNINRIAFNDNIRTNPNNQFSKIILIKNRY